MLNKKPENFDYILFDLDGTLTDSAIGITNSALYALRKFGIEVPDRRSLYCMIGPPLLDSFQKYHHLTLPEATQAVAWYREYFRERGIFENQLYCGIPELLQNLRAAGKILAVASAKPEVFVRRILEHFALTEYFQWIVGTDLSGGRASKAEVVGEVLRQIPQDQHSAVLMIGDRNYDIAGAQAHHLHSVGVLFGYGSRQELQDAGADFLAPSVEDLQALLLPKHD